LRTRLIKPSFGSASALSTTVAVGCTT
jgi:hypothetical protein